MDLTGERNIAATRDVVWLALNDPTILKNSIPGCEELETLPDGGFTASVGVKMGFGLQGARTRYFGMIARASIQSS
jgi:carbon monoxide dehydrogenase subunit G